MRKLFFIIGLLPCLNLSSQDNDWKLWYRYPANEWEEALPVGNGRLGGMIFGGIERERISLNEESIWSFPFKPVMASSKTQYLIEGQRKLIYEGKYLEADQLAVDEIELPENATIIEREIEDMYTGRSIYKPLADLYLHFGSTESIPTDYKRELDIESAVSTVTYKIDEVTYTREVIASYPDQAIVVRLTADKPGMISFSSKMTRRVDVKDDMYRYDAELGEKVESITRPPDPIINVVGDDHFSFSGTADPQGVSYVAHFKLLNEGGEKVSIPNGFRVEGADAATIFITAATDYKHENPNQKAQMQVEKVASFSYDEIKLRHIADYQKLYKRVDIKMEKSRNSLMSTDRRVEAHQLGIVDPRVTPGTPRDNDLYALYFQYSRYLMIASSRAGTLPPALQGIWNDSLLPPWFGHYTTDINIQMNYWPAEVCNLSENHKVLLDFVYQYMDICREVAEIAYGTRGMVFNSMSPWGPRHTYAKWNDYTGWLAQHFWEHYAYTLDKDFLKDKGYPFIKEAALFYADFMVENPESKALEFGPNYSPENCFYIEKDGKKQKAFRDMGITMSRAIAYEVFTNAINASEVFDVDSQLRKELASKRDQLAPYKVGKYGQLQEWSEDFEEVYPGHRHLSHLYGLYPGSEITKEKTPEVFEAARKSVDRRLAHNSGWTGWSRAWMICLAAHLQDGELAREQLELLFERTTLYNLFDTHPRQGGNTTCFQIEGNMGAVAGMAEMLMQSHEDFINLLPAKPKNWRKGYVTGLKARGAFEIDVYWNQSKLEKVKVYSLKGNHCKLKYNNKLIEFDTVIGGEYTFNKNLEKVL